MPHEVPLIVSVPVLVVTQDPLTEMPQALSVPFTAVPVIVTLPPAVAEIVDELSKTPLELIPEPFEVPLTVSKPVVVVTQEPIT